MSGDASPMRMASNSPFWSWDFSRFSKSFKALPPVDTCLYRRRQRRRGSKRLRLLVFQLDVDAQGADLLHQYVEGLRHAGLHAVIAVDDILVHLGTTVDVIGLDGEHLLEGVGRAIGFQRPHFHLPEPLATELGLAPQRLLGNEAVGAGGAGVHLVIHQVVELEHVHVTDGDRAVEGFTGTTIEQGHLTALRHVGELQQLLDLFFLGAVEHRSRHGYTLGEVLGELQHFIVGERGNFLRPGAGAGVVDLLDEAAYLGDLALLLEHGVDLLAQALGGEAEVGFENLANVHPRRHAEGVQHDVHGDAIDVVGHVLHRLDGGDHTLVAVATGHLVTGLDAALDRQVDLDGLEYAGGEVVAALQLALLVLEALVLLLAALLEQF